MDLSKIDKCIICQIEFDNADIIVTNNNCDCKTKFHKDCYNKYIEYEKKNNNNDNLFCTICKNKLSLLSKESSVVIDINSDNVIVKQSNPCIKRIRKIVFLKVYLPIMSFSKNIKNSLKCKKNQDKITNCIEYYQINCCCIFFWIKSILSILIFLIGLFVIGFISNLFLCTHAGAKPYCIVCVISSVISGFSAFFMIIVVYGSIKEKYVNKVYAVYSLLNSANFITAFITDSNCQIRYGLYFLAIIMFFICFGCMHSIDIRNCDT